MNNIITIGNFDGLHLGHRKLLSVLVDLANEHALNPVVLTYTSHPLYTLSKPPYPMLLSPNQIKIQKIRELGIKDIDLIQFDWDFSQQSAFEFLTEYMIPKHKPHTIVVGFDSHFGHDREGNFDFLSKYSSKYKYRLVYVDPVLDNNSPISSSTIRRLLHAGYIKEANRLLGEDYTVYGEVIKGKGWGRKLGFPTANLSPMDIQQLLPKSGIYLTTIYFDKQKHFALTNMGTSPTLKSEGIFEIEAYILDFTGDLYGKNVRLSFHERLRDEIKFADSNDLISAIENDVKHARDLIGKMQ